MTRHAGDAAAIVRNEGVGVVLHDVHPTDSEFEEIFNFIQDVYSQREEYMAKCQIAARKHRSSNLKEALCSTYSLITA